MDACTQVERLASRMLRNQEKHREKLRQQAAQYRQAAGHLLTSQNGRDGCLPALSSIRARIEIVRCLKELHKSELRIEMCADDVVSSHIITCSSDLHQIAIFFGHASGTKRKPSLSHSEQGPLVALQNFSFQGDACLKKFAIRQHGCW